MLNIRNRREKRNRSILYNKKGIAVVMALAVVLLLMTAALELFMNERTNMLNAAALRDRLTLDQMAESGIHLAMALLIKDRLESETDSLQEDWADPETISGFLSEIPFEEGQLVVKIFDEMSKIQANALVQFPEGQQFNESQRKLWERFANNLLALYEDLDDTDPLTIIYSVKDWLDSGDDDAITGLSGAETDYYQGLDPPYACKNGPFDHLSEIRLVKGITPEVFNGLGGVTGLGSYVTVYGAVETNDQKFTYPGKININTAELPVLTALLPSEASEFAQLLIDFREATSGSQYTHDLTSVNWYKSVPGLANVTIDPALITVASDTFRVVATATLHNIRTTTTAVIQRERSTSGITWQCKILNWNSE